MGVWWSWGTTYFEVKFLRSKSVRGTTYFEISVQGTTFSEVKCPGVNLLRSEVSGERFFFLGGGGGGGGGSSHVS